MSYKLVTEGDEYLNSARKESEASMRGRKVEEVRKARQQKTIPNSPGGNMLG